MSHISKIELVVNDLAALKEACQNLGFEFREGQRTYTWYGRLVGRFALPEGLTESDLGKCDHAIRIPGATYEVGIVKKEQNYLLLWDEWDKGGLRAKLGHNAGILKQAYALSRVKREARKKNYRFAQKKIPNGIRLTLTA